MKSSILIIDDELSMCTLLSLALEQEYDVHYATTAQDGIKYLQEKKVDLILLDLMIGSSDGIVVLKQIRKFNSSVSVIMMTAYGSIPTSVEAIRNGAFTYLVKPLDIEELNVFIRQALDVKQLNEQCEYLTEELKGYYSYHEIVGKSPAIQKVFEMIEKLKDLDTSVMIYGESGTGKELYAQAIHNASPRSAGVFVAINCANFNANMLESELFGYTEGAFTGAKRGGKIGLFEAAAGGTLFLDEISEMDVGLQSKLLRALQERRIRPVGGVEEVETDVRIIAACNADLPRYVEEGKFRTDLFYRLNTFPIHIPPLRERREDIPPLCRSLLDELSRKLKRRLELTPEALDRLLAHNWPGNVRELRNVLEFCAYLTSSGVITELSLPENLRTGPTAQPPLTLAQRTRTFERAEILRLLERNGASLEGKKKTAAQLGISLASLYNKLNMQF